MSFRIEVARRSIHVHEEGASSDPVLLIHSSGLGARQWRRVAEVLGARHRLLLPDLIGYGESSPVTLGERIHFVMDLLALERLVDRVASPLHVVGHSYGGFLALLLTLHRPDRVRSLSVYEPVAFGVLRSEHDQAALATLPSTRVPWPSTPTDVEAWLEGFIGYWNGEGAWHTLAESMRESFRASAPKVIGEVLTLGADPTPLEAYTSIAAPTLLLSGVEPPIAPDHVLALLERTIAKSARKRIQGAGHMGPITHAGEVAEALLRHVEAS